MLELLIIVGLTLVVSVFVAVIKGYARLWHWLFDGMKARRQRRAILEAAKRDRQ